MRLYSSADSFDDHKVNSGKAQDLWHGIPVQRFRKLCNTDVADKHTDEWM